MDDHDVRKHYPNGPDLVDDVAGSKRCLPEAFVHVAQAIEEALVLRERCRLRRYGSPSFFGLTAFTRVLEGRARVSVDPVAEGRRTLLPAEVRRFSQSMTPLEAERPGATGREMSSVSDSLETCA